jgi:hypothetical protein
VAGAAGTSPALVTVGQAADYSEDCPTRIPLRGTNPAVGVGQSDAPLYMDVLTLSLPLKRVNLAAPPLCPTVLPSSTR